MKKKPINRWRPDCGREDNSDIVHGIIRKDLGKQLKAKTLKNKKQPGGGRDNFRVLISNRLGGTPPGWGSHHGYLHKKSI